MVASSMYWQEGIKVVTSSCHPLALKSVILPIYIRKLGD